jgi:hypothetical protein
MYPTGGQNMPLMEAYRLTLRERVHSTKAIALDDPTNEHVADFGRALMEHWANSATGARPWMPKVETE